MAIVKSHQDRNVLMDFPEYVSIQPLGIPERRLHLWLFSEIFLPKSSLDKYFVVVDDCRKDLEKVVHRLIDVECLALGPPEL